MRTYKLLLISIVFLLLLAMIYGTINVYATTFKIGKFLTVLLFVGFGFILGIVSLVYQLKTLQYYGSSGISNKKVNFPAFLWVFTVLCNLYFLLLSVLIFFGIMEGRITDGEDMFVAVVLLMASLYGVFGIIEAFLLKRKLGKHQKGVVAINEIEEIGN